MENTAPYRQRASGTWRTLPPTGREPQGHGEHCPLQAESLRDMENTAPYRQRASWDMENTAPYRQRASGTWRTLPPTGREPQGHGEHCPLQAESLRDMENTDRPDRTVERPRTWEHCPTAESDPHGATAPLQAESLRDMENTAPYRLHQDCVRGWF
ncbi:hypothetical protein NHX12_008640 [Muraenolepis orangiensis]|uniref:Uncharacterized protein n=1 Tax=Muraenolepis orangiensis TaxID=630683 RepID=A0A9Q0DLU4_9TELE|nr:hypothetical protein NHX12_008640 [Muraenolepis orangiensis]